MPRYRDAPPKKTTQRLAERVALQSQQLMEKRQQKEQQKEQQKQRRKKKKIQTIMTKMTMKKILTMKYSKEN